MAKIYVANINEVVEESQIAKFVDLISDEKREKIERFHFHEDYLRSLYGDILVRKGIETEFGIESKDITFDKNTYGKPFVVGIPDVHYNISHSGDWVVCIISRQECGIDVEKIDKAHMDIAKRYFTNAEYKTLETKVGEAQREYFYDLWTLKESYIKYKGKGLQIPLNSFGFEQRGGSFYLDSNNEEQLSFQQFTIDQGYKLSACVKEDITELNYVTIGELL